MELISNTLAGVICEQIGQEILNSHIYLQMCGFLRNKGLDKIAKQFEDQYEEEASHSRMLFNLLTDLNAPVVIPEIDEVDNSFSSIMDIAKLYLEKEIQTTNSLNEIKKLAIEENNPVVEERMRKMIKLQQNELSEASSFMDMAILLPEWWMLAVRELK